MVLPAGDAEARRLGRFPPFRHVLHSRLERTFVFQSARRSRAIIAVASPGPSLSAVFGAVFRKPQIHSQPSSGSH